MTEADLLYHFQLLREQLDETIAQVIGLTFALFIANYYFLHRAGLVLKIGTFVLYLIGWYFFVVSGMLTAEHLSGVVQQLGELEKQKTAGSTTIAVLKMMRSEMSGAYVLAANIANFIMLVGVAGFLTFWKPPAELGQLMQPDEEKELD